MESTENYEELKWTLKSFLQFVTSDKLHYAVFLLVWAVIAFKIIDLIFIPIHKRKNRSMLAVFTHRCLQVLVIVTFGIRIGAMSETLSSFGSQILMSSSLLVVVLGFVFQEGLSNIVHGFILSVFAPFHLGDRVIFTIDGESITGYIREMTVRHTVVQNVMNSSHVIIPNSKMDLCVIDNNYYDENSLSSNFLDISITYESDLKKAIGIMSEVIGTHPMVAEARKSKGITEPVNVLVRELGDSAVYLRASVQTHTVEENFSACSDIRRDLVLRIQADPDVHFAYPHMQLVAETTDS